jgi:hypothetical protein
MSCAVFMNTVTTPRPSGSAALTDDGASQRPVPKLPAVST